MKKTKEIYICSECSKEFSKWQGQCSSCNAWNTLEMAVAQVAKNKNIIESRNKPQLLQEVFIESSATFSSGIEALDKILGNGIVPGAALLIGGEPGIGKSTLLLQLAAAVAKNEKTVLYISGEETLMQIKQRAERLNALHPHLLALSTNSTSDILPLLEGSNIPSLLIVDSVQTLYSEQATGFAGNVSQVKAVATELIEACKKCGTALILVGHVTKENTLAGPRLLEHSVDTVISLEGDRSQGLRLFRVLKNRFGPNHELLVFKMEQEGLLLIDDPSTLFLEARDTSLSGTAMVMALDSHRPLVVEVQALVTQSFLSIPRRTALGFDINRLNLLLAVLEKRLKLNFSQVDIYVKLGGGIKLNDPAIDLALIAAVLSSYYDKALPEKAVFWGEVDLNGQIRPTQGQELRKTQANKLKYAPIVYPHAQKNKNTSLLDFQKFLFGSEE